MILLQSCNAKDDSSTLDVPSAIVSFSSLKKAVGAELFQSLVERLPDDVVVLGVAPRVPEPKHGERDVLQRRLAVAFGFRLFHRPVEELFCVVRRLSLSVTADEEDRFSSFLQLFSVKVVESRNGGRATERTREIVGQTL